MYLEQVLQMLKQFFTLSLCLMFCNTGYFIDGGGGGGYRGGFRGRGDRGGYRGRGGDRGRGGYRDSGPMKGSVIIFNSITLFSTESECNCWAKLNESMLILLTKNTIIVIICNFFSVFFLSQRPWSRKVQTLLKEKTSRSY